MRRIDCHRREQRLDRLRVEILDVLARVGPQLAEAEHANRFCGQRRNQFVAPAIVLIFDESVNPGGQLGEHFFGNAAVGARLAVAVLDLLQHAGDANLDELVQVAGGDREKLHALEQRIGRVAGLFENALVELQPGEMAVEEKPGS